MKMAPSVSGPLNGAQLNRSYADWRDYSWLPLPWMVSSIAALP